MRLFILIMGLMFVSAPAMAQETAPGDACTAGETNYIRQAGGPETSGVFRIMRCDGSNWLERFSIMENGQYQLATSFGGAENLLIQNRVGNTSGISFRGTNGGRSVGIQNTYDPAGTGNGTMTFFTRDNGTFAERMRIAPNGHVGIGTDAPDTLLTLGSADGSVGGALKLFHGSGGVASKHLTIDAGAAADEVVFGWHQTTDLVFRNGSGTDLLVIDGDGTPQGNIGIRKSDPAAALDVVGDIFYTGVTRDQSDRRVKDDIRPIGPALAKLRRIEGVSFVMKDDPDKMRELGVIAQDVRAVYPDLVAEMSNGILGLNYNGLIAPLIEAVKELDDQDAAQDEAHAAEIERLEAENAELRRMVHALSARMDVIEGKRRPPLKPYNP